MVEIFGSHEGAVQGAGREGKSGPQERRASILSSSAPCGRIFFGGRERDVFAAIVGRSPMAILIFS